MTRYSNFAFRLEGARQQLIMSLHRDSGVTSKKLADAGFIGSRSFSGRAARLARVTAPYVMDRFDDGRLIVLNREYTPIGCGGSKHAHYPDFNDAIIEPWPELLDWLGDNLKTVQAMRMWSFYDDGCPPWSSRDHAERQVRLIEGLIEQVEPGWFRD